MFRQLTLIFLTVQPKLKKEAIIYWGLGMDFQALGIETFQLHLL